MDLNTCFETTNNLRTIASYSHFLPIIASILLGGYLLVQTKFSLISKVFFAFIMSINFWLVADVIVWTQDSYNLVHFFWSFFEYINVIFFLLGLYFFIVFVRQRDIHWGWKLGGFLLTIPAFVRMVTVTSIYEFNQPWCESINSDFLVMYKNYIEAFVIVIILFFMGRAVFTKNTKSSRNQILIVGSALILFFVTFAGTDYLSVQTGNYEIGLYGLFVTPVFLGLIVYAIVKYKAFNVGVLGAQALVATLVVLIGTQFFFIKNPTNIALNAVTFLLVLIFGYFLVRGVKRDLQVRKKLEELTNNLQHTNTRLKELDAQKTEFISLATHQIRGPLGSIKGYASMLLEGDYGEFPEKARSAVNVILRSAQSLVIVVGDYLDVSRIEQGRMKFDFSNFDMKELVSGLITELKPVVNIAKLDLTFECDETTTYMTHADMGKIKQVIGNLVDNSIKYTPRGSVHISLTKNAGKVLVSIKDTGIGIKKEVIPLLFNKFSRAPDAGKTNIMGTGLGLFVAKKIIEAHKGRVWAESEGEGKGSQFYVELGEVRDTEVKKL